jgi:hypothetical protein
VDTNTQIPETRSFFGLGEVSNKVYVIGGDTQMGNWTSNVFVFDSLSDTWTNGPAMPGGERAGMGAAVLDGKIYVVGGFSDDYLRRVEVLDPATGIWETRAPMLVQRFSPAVGVIGGLLYVAGGGNGPGAESSIEIYNPTNNTWTAGPDLPEPHTGPGIVLDGRLYVIGGGPSPTNKVFVFDPAWNGWTQLSPMSEARDDVALAVDEAGKRILRGRRLQPALLEDGRDVHAARGPVAEQRFQRRCARSLRRGAGDRPGHRDPDGVRRPAPRRRDLSVLTAPNEAPVISDILNQTARRGQPTQTDSIRHRRRRDSGRKFDALRDFRRPVAGGGHEHHVRRRRREPDRHCDPNPGRAGTVLITVIVSDGAATGRDQFELKVSGGTDAQFYGMTKGQQSLQTNSGPPVPTARIRSSSNRSSTKCAGVHHQRQRDSAHGVAGHWCVKTTIAIGTTNGCFRRSPTSRPLSPPARMPSSRPASNEGRRTNLLQFPGGRR